MFQFQCGILYITFSLDLIYFPLKEAGHDGLYLHDLHWDLLAGDVVLELLEAPLHLPHHAVHHVPLGHHAGDHPVSANELFHCQLHRNRRLVCP